MTITAGLASSRRATFTQAREEVRIHLQTRLAAAGPRRQIPTVIKGRLFVLSGAGLSAESGIPTFRGPGGLYASGKAESTFSAGSFRADPGAVTAVLERLRERVQAAHPNSAHAFLSSLEREGTAVRHFTQNVDDLLERAGAADVVHLHGRLNHARCIAREHAITLSAGTPIPTRCPRQSCASPMRHDVVLFDEEAPEYSTLRRTLKRATADDALVVVGTSGSILPINDLAQGFPGWTGLANLEPELAIDGSRFHSVTWGPATTALPELLSRANSQPPSGGGAR